MIELPRKNIQDNFSSISGEKSGSFPPHCKSAFDVTPRQIAWLTVRCRIRGERRGPLTSHPGPGLVHRCPCRIPSANFNHPFKEGWEWRRERRDLAATDAPLYFVNVSIDHRMLLGFALFHCPSSSVPLPSFPSLPIAPWRFTTSCFIADVIAVALSLYKHSLSLSIMTLIGM